MLVQRTLYIFNEICYDYVWAVTGRGDDTFATTETSQLNDFVAALLILLNLHFHFIKLSPQSISRSRLETTDIQQKAIPTLLYLDK